MKKFDFEEVNLLPKLCVVDSRSEIDTSITFGSNKFKLLSLLICSLLLMKQWLLS